jgi:protein SCO1/2
LAVILVITASWWALALWPLPGSAPDWLVRTRTVCFGSTPSGLPDNSGWLLLVGQPLGMVAVLLVVWGDAVADGLRALARSVAGRASLAGVAVLLALGIGAAAARVAGAATRGTTAVVPTDFTSIPRLDRPAPALALVDQHGAAVTLERFRGRPLLLTFAFAHCETVCPLVVHDVLEARRRMAGPPPAVVIVTLDPWRDTPARLPSIAARWRLDGDALVVSGAVADVAATLDRWNIARARDPRTGDVIHPAVVFLIDREGRIAYAVNGGAEAIGELLRRL